MTIEYVDPRAEPVTAAEPYSLSLDPGTAAVGVLANGFPDSGRFADHLATALGAALPEAQVRTYAKADASSIAPDQLLDGIAAECQAAVTLYGH